ncbi:hypothetical protein IWW57_002061 [Coemansia sp. S610]|nr:hypothetical protein IWW57_002061 [Coemansia sp. S610]
MNKFAHLSGVILLLAAPLASGGSGAVTAKGPNSTWTFQWPWSTNSKQDIPIPGSSFTPDVTIYSPFCLWGVMRLSSKFDTTCFQNSKSLYFSAPGQVCSPRCLDTTISMSQYMVEKCGLEWPRADQPVGYNHKDVVYLSWADRSLSELVSFMASTVAERYFAATLHIVFSEIAYYRYLFPDSFFKIVNYENVSVHALIRGKSIESDQLLASVDGACDAMAHECLQTFVIGLSIHPTKHTFIRELYAFQLGYGADYKLLGTRSKSGKTTELFLRRLAALLRQMEALALPILMSMRMALTDNAPPGYTPPGFQSFMAKDVEDYTIYPNCGNTRVGKAAKGESSMFMCCVSVEGPLQTPPLGSMLCSMPMSLEVNRDSQVVVFVAVPSWPTANPETSVVTLPFQQLDSGESCAHEVPMPTTQVRPSIELCITSQENKRNSTAENHPKCECLGPKVDDDAVSIWIRSQLVATMIGKLTHCCM